MEKLDRNSTVAVVGLGAIGLPVAINLVKAGTATQVWNRSDAPAQKATAAGAVRVSNLADIDAKFVITVLPDIFQVNELLDKGLQTSLKPGDVFVVMGTVSPVAMRTLGERLNKIGVEVLDAPVSGGDIGAQQATLSIMVGGKADVLAQIQPFFAQIGTTIRHLGALGAGQMAKACNQIIVATNLSAIAEAVALGRSAGLDENMLLDIFSGGMANSRTLELKREKIQSGDFTPGGLSAFQLKDLKIVLEAAADTGTALPVTETVTTLYQSMVDNDQGHLDHSAVLLEILRRSNKG